MAISIKDYRAQKIIGADDSTLLTVLGGTIGVDISSTIGAAVVFPTTSTVQAVLGTTTATQPVSGTVSLGITNATIPISGSVALTTSNATIPVSFAITSTLGAAVSGTVTIGTTTATIPISGSVALLTSNATIPVSFAITSTVQTVSAAAYTSSAVWSSTVVADSATSGLSGDMSSYSKIGAFVEVSDATDVTVQTAPDTATAVWYPDSKISFDTSATQAFAFDCVRTGRYYRFTASTGVEISAVFSGKT